MSKKKSFVLYFDSVQQILALPDAQLGLLFRALIDCAAREAGGEDGLAGFTQRFPAMTEATQMAFQFLAATIRRDTRTYEKKCANYRAAAQRRQEQRQGASRPPSAPASDSAWNYV